MNREKETEFMQAALKEAKKAMREGEVPVGAVIVKGKDIISRAYNQTIRKRDPTAHAEILAIRRAAIKEGDFRLAGTRMYVTVKPCPMCRGALALARVKRVIYSAPPGKVLPLPRVSFRSGVLRDQCQRVMKDFFKKMR